jgi:hypothetical protein
MGIGPREARTLAKLAVVLSRFDKKTLSASHSQRADIATKIAEQS